MHIPRKGGRGITALTVTKTISRSKVLGNYRWSSKLGLCFLGAVCQLFLGVLAFVNVPLGEVRGDELLQKWNARNCSGGLEEKRFVDNIG